MLVQRNFILSLFAVMLLLVFGVSLTFSGSSAAVIGGSDGPTAVFVAAPAETTAP